MPEVDAVLRALGIEHGVTWERLARRVATRSGRVIRVQAIGDRRWRNATGALSRMKEVDLILVRHSDSALYRTHSVLHEFGHILLDHARCDVPIVLAREDDQESAAELIAHHLAECLYWPPDFDDQRVLG